MGLSGCVWKQTHTPTLHHTRTHTYKGESLGGRVSNGALQHTTSVFMLPCLFPLCGLPCFCASGPGSVPIQLCQHLADCKTIPRWWMSTLHQLLICAYGRSTQNRSHSSMLRNAHKCHLFQTWIYVQSPNTSAGHPSLHVLCFSSPFSPFYTHSPYLFCCCAGEKWFTNDSLFPSTHDFWCPLKQLNLFILLLFLLLPDLTDLVSYVFQQDSVCACLCTCARARAWLTRTGSQKFQRMHLFFSFFLSFNNNGLTSCDPGNGLLPRPLLLCDSAAQAARSQGHFQRTCKYILVAVPGRKASLFVVTGWLNVFTILTLNCLNLLGGKWRDTLTTINRSFVE